MADRLFLPARLRDLILAHCRKARPQEGCGLFARQGDHITWIYPTANDAPEMNMFVVPPAEHYSALRDAESRGWKLGGSFHSHPDGPAVPSRRDIEGALDPQWIYLVAGLRNPPDLRAWSIAGGAVSEVVLVPDD